MNLARVIRPLLCSWLCLLVAGCLPRGTVDLETFRLCPSAGGGLDMCGRTRADGFKVDLASCTNAIMRVTAFRDGRRIKQWTGEVRWTGTIPDDGVYTGTVERGRVTWNGAAPEGLRVETDRRGNGGIPLRRWLPRGADRVEVRVDPGYGAGRGVGRSQRRRGAGGGAERGDRGAASSSTRSPGGAGRGTAGRGDGGAGSGDPCGLRGGGASGQRGGASAEDGGVPDAWSPTPWGEAYGDAEGAAGGDGARGEHGIRGAWALLGVFGISRKLRAAAELAVIAADVTGPEAFVRRAVARVGRRVARAEAAQVAAKLRRELADEARTFANAEVKRLRPAFEAELLGKGKSRDEIERVIRWLNDSKRVQYFELVERAAGRNAIVRRAAEVKPVAGQLPRNHEYARELFVVDARAYPDAARIVRERGKQGVKFTREGYPVFDPWVYKQGRFKADVRIKNTRRAETDFTAADRAMRLKLRDPGWKRPKGWTWHHTTDVGETSRMILVPEELHRRVRHTGGMAHYRQRMGDYDAYQRIPVRRPAGR